MQGGWEEVAGRVDSLQFTLNQLLPTLSVGQFTKFTKPKQSMYAPECQNSTKEHVLLLSTFFQLADIILCLCSKSLRLKLSADSPVKISLKVNP